MRVSHEVDVRSVQPESGVREDIELAGQHPNQQDRHQVDVDDGVLTVPITESKIPRWWHGRGRARQSKVINWLNGTTHRRLSIQPLLPRVQAWPAKLVSKYLPTTGGEYLLVTVLCLIWIIAFTVILVDSSRADRVPGFGKVVKIPCTARLWSGSQACGVNGTNCLPFTGGDFAFSCPSGCTRSMVLEPHALGNQEINYHDWVIGGPRIIDGQESNMYRGDSFICGAALHGGVIDDSSGGCGILHRAGEQGNFTASDRNGISSLSFEPRFPFSFTIEPVSQKCEDPQERLLALSVVITAAIAIFTTSPAAFFVPVFAIAFFQTALASDAPFASTYADAVSTAMARFLPCAAVGYIIYRFCVQRTLKDLRAPLEKTVLWVGACWVSALNKYTFDRIPISRLTASDIKQQPGAITALVIILIILILAVIGQIWAFRIEGRLLKLLRLYVILGILLGLLAALPGLSLRLHHYIIGILLLPGTAIQTRPSLLYQGLLVGLFINGIARWDFASIVQTPAVLLGNGLIHSVLPYIATPAFFLPNGTASNSTTSSIASFTIPESRGGYTGISMLVNDVERYQASNFSFPGTINWTRMYDDEPVFFRFAYMGASAFGGLVYGDYSHAGTWWPNGTWVDVKNFAF